MEWPEELGQQVIGDALADESWPTASLGPPGDIGPYTEHDRLIAAGLDYFPKKCSDCGEVLMVQRQAKKKACLLTPRCEGKYEPMFEMPKRRTKTYWKVTPEGPVQITKKQFDLNHKEYLNDDIQGG